MSNKNNIIQGHFGQPRARKTDTPSLEQWQKLFDLSFKFRDMKPWQYIHEDQLTILNLPKRKEPLYVSAINDDSYQAVGVYPDQRAAHAMLALSVAESHHTAAIYNLELNGFHCVFGEKGNTTAADREVYEKLGLNFQADEPWIYFRRMRPGCPFNPITTEDAELLITALQGAYVTMDAYLSGAMGKSKLKKNEILYRRFDTDSQQWQTGMSIMPQLKFSLSEKSVYPLSSYTIAVLKNKKSKKPWFLEFEQLYMPMPSEIKEDTVVYPKTALLIDAQTGELYSQVFEIDDSLEPEEAGLDFDTRTIDALLALILEQGKPEAILIRNPEAAELIAGVCRSLALTVETQLRLPHSAIYAGALFAEAERMADTAESFFTRDDIDLDNPSPEDIIELLEMLGYNIDDLLSDDE